MRRTSILALTILASGISAAHADIGDIYLYNIRTNPDQFFRISLQDPATRHFIDQTRNYGTFGMDFDPTASILYAHNASTNELGVISVENGAFTPIGPLTGIAAGQAVTGLTVAPNGAAYLSSVNATGTSNELYSLNLTSGACTLIGVMTGASFVIHISADNRGALYAHDIGIDGLLSINPATGAATTIGLHGLAANFAQGMDFDWSTNTLYAAIYTGDGAGRLVSWDTATGAITTILDTGAAGWNAEMEMAIRVPAKDDPACAADWNEDDVVNSQDFFDFLTAFFANNADFNTDKVTNSQDFFDFLTAFFDGC